MKCINLKQKLSKKLYCKKQNKEITFKDCNNCKFKEYEIKYKPMVHKNNKNRTIKNKTKKLAKLEKNRKSIFTTDLTHCIICGRKKEHLHEVYSGSFRLRSIKNDMVIPLCFEHHREIHNNIKLSLYYKQLCQKLYEKNHSREEFIKIFGRNYL